MELLESMLRSKVVVRGMRNLVKKNCDLLVRINTNKEVESLNVSVATAIALNEIYRNKNV